MSIALNIVLSYLLVKSPLTNNADAYLSSNPGNINTSYLEEDQLIYDEIISGLSIEDQREYQIYHGTKPIFYGTWKIVDLVWAELAQPSYISGYYHNDDGSISLRGPGTSAILGEEITFSLDYAEFSGVKHEYICRPRTYTYPLSNNDIINYNYAKTLEITGNYYSVIEFLLPDHDKIRENDDSFDVRINDIRELYIKDYNVIYANAYYGITYKLERVNH